MSTTSDNDGEFGHTVAMPTLSIKDRMPRSGEGQPPPAKIDHPAVALVQGSTPDFSKEMNSLLQDRLRLASQILFWGYLAYLVKVILVPTYEMGGWSLALHGMLAVVTAITGTIAFRLCVSCRYAVDHLRAVEAVLFGSSAGMFLVAGFVHLLQSAQHGYLANITPPWMMLIFTYALFIPTSWRRALVVIVSCALGPVIVLLLASLASPEVSSLVDDVEDFHHIFVEMIMGMTFASALALSGVKVIRTLRTKAFEAQELGQYRLKQLIGRGGMGEVYLAEHRMLKRPCAIKVIRPEKAGDPATLSRFEQEVQATAKLTHWNTVEIFDFGRTDDGTFYYVMEYLPGMSLDQIVTMSGPMPASRVVHLLAQVCDGLAEAHEHKLVHRDIKPANIFAAKRGGTYDVAKVLDFGLVRSFASEEQAMMTQENVVTGSPLYMSPEQARGDDVDGRGDIYALGCVAYFLLTGRAPFNESQAIKVLIAHAQQRPILPSQFNPRIPKDLEDVLLKCMEKEPSDRYEDVLELRAALQACADAHQWSRKCAAGWWEHNGCPVKKGLDSSISQENRIDLVEQSLEATVHAPALR